MGWHQPGSTKLASFALTMASKLPLAKKSQRWVFSGLAEQITDMLPSSALFMHFSP